MNNVVQNNGKFVQMRGRRWLVENTASFDGRGDVIYFACLDDDAQVQTIKVAWLAETDGTILGNVRCDSTMLCDQTASLETCEDRRHKPFAGSWRRALTPAFYAS